MNIYINGEMRPATDEEQKLHDLTRAELAMHEKQKQKIALLRTSAIEKLKDLGLTNDEIAALVG